ncbi:MAG: hypothetical protein AAB429_02625 [Patescibacteria group bacterium]
MTRRKNVEKKKVRKPFLGPAGKETLNFLSDMLDAMTATPGEAALALKYGGNLAAARAMADHFEKRREAALLKQLRKKRMIRDRQKGTRVVLELTDDGQAYVLKERIVATKKKLPLDRLCLVSFDFPERARHARLAFRELLKRAHFTRLHDSVWISRHDVLADVKNLIKLLKSSDWISAFLVVEK